MLISIFVFREVFSFSKCEKVKPFAEPGCGSHLLESFVSDRARRLLSIIFWAKVFLIKICNIFKSQKPPFRIAPQDLVAILYTAAEACSFF